MKYPYQQAQNVIPFPSIHMILHPYCLQVEYLDQQTQIVIPPQKDFHQHSYDIALLTVYRWSTQTSSHRLGSPPHKDYHQIYMILHSLFSTGEVPRPANTDCDPATEGFPQAGSPASSSAFQGHIVTLSVVRSVCNDKKKIQNVTTVWSATNVSKNFIPLCHQFAI